MATHVLYTGPLASKTISAAKWLQKTGEVASSTTWNAANNFAIPVGSFSKAQLLYFQGTTEFVQADGVRPAEFIPVDGIPDNIQLYIDQGRLADNAAYRTVSSAKQTITYNADGTVATVTETDTGAVTTYTYNADLSPATESRLLSGVTTLRTFTYVSGNLTAVA